MRRARIQSAYETVLKGGVWVLLGRGMSVVATVVMTALLARQLSFEEFGAFFVARSLAAGLCIVVMLGWNSALVRFLAESLAAGNFTRARQVVSIACLTVGVSSAASLILLFGPLGESLGSWLHIPHSSAVMPLLAVWMCLSACHQLLGEGLRGCHQQQFANFFAGEMGGPLANAAFCLVLLAAGRGFVPTLVSCLWANVIIQILLLPLAAGLLWQAVRSGGMDENVSAAKGTAVSWIVIASVGLPMMVMHSLSFVVSQGDLWIAAKFCDAENVALFAAARRLTLLVVTPQALANLAVLPIVASLFAQGRIPELQNILQKTAAFASIPAVLAAASLLLCPGLVIGLIFGDDYRVASTATAILVSGHLFLVFAGAASAALTMTGHHRNVLWINCLSAAVLIFVGPAAAQIWGASGIATVVAIAIALQSMFTWVQARQLIGVWTHASWRPFTASSIAAP